MPKLAWHRSPGRVALLLPLLVCITMAACSPGKDGGIPRLSVGLVDGMPVDDPEIPRLLEALTRLLLLVDEGRLADLATMVSEEKGVYVDLKSHRKRTELAAEIADKNNYLPLYYLDTPGLKKSTGDETQIAIRDLIRRTREIKVDFYREAADECELKLHLVGDEEGTFRLNNPVFIRENGTWLVYRLF